MESFTMNAPPGTQSVVITRDFAAAPAAVFHAYADPAYVPRWWGPDDEVTVIDQLALETGGFWRFIQRGATGDEYAYHGSYHEVRSPNRLVFTFEYEPMPGSVYLEIIDLAAIPEGGTRLTDTTLFQSEAIRDQWLAAGLEAGTDEAYARLAALLPELDAAAPE